MVDFVAQGSRKVDDTHQNPEIFDASGVHIFILPDLTTQLATRPLNILYVSRLIQ